MEAGEPKYESPEVKQVTERTYEQYVEFFGIPENYLEGKTILDVGSGFSNFVEVANEKFADSGTKAIGVDPVYAFFGDDFKRFEKQLIGSGLFLHLAYGLRPAEHTKDLTEWNKKRSGFYHDFYEKAKRSKTYVAGSHQQLPFKNSSIDLVLGNNSVLYWEDKNIIRQAMTEILRVLKPAGEGRFQPIDLQWDPTVNEVVLVFAGKVTKETSDTWRRTGKFLDDKMFNTLLDLETRGAKFYSFSVVFPTTEKDELGRKEVKMFGNLIMRKDDAEPVIDVSLRGFSDLRRLYFSKSPDSYVIPSAIITTP